MMTAPAMHARQDLWSRLECALAHDEERFDAMQAWPDLSPWAFCTLVAIARHRVRQAWVREVVRERLGGDPRKMAELGALGHPADAAQSGRVPGLTDWKYFFHGRGCCLTSVASGESIDVDFHLPDGRADVIDPYFFGHYLESLRNPEPVEANLIELHPSLDTISVSVGELVDRGFLVEGRARFTPEAESYEGLLRSIGARFRRAAAVLSEEAVVERRRMLLAKDGSKSDSLALLAFAETSPPTIELHRLLESAIADAPVNGRTSRALDLLIARNDREDCATVFALFCRLDPAGDAPNPFLWTRCSEFLLRHSFSVDRVLATLDRVGGSELGEAALLALEYVPALARPLLRKALRAGTPHDRGIAAATLALVGEPWALDDLEAVLLDTSDEGPTAECRAALRALEDPNGTCARWEGTHGVGRGDPMTIEALVIRSTEERVRWEIERLRSRVDRLKPRPS